MLKRDERIDKILEKKEKAEEEVVGGLEFSLYSLYSLVISCLVLSSPSLSIARLLGGLAFYPKEFN